MWHDPELAEKRASWAKSGGHGRANEARARKRIPDGMMSNQELQGVLGVTIHDALAGRVEPGVANAVANLARAYVTVQEAGAAETLQQELDELRVLVSERGLA